MSPHEDKQGWPPGPWNDEPDRVDFKAHGLPCFILRGPLGQWCGYAGVTPGHSLYGVEDCPSLDVHGGVTYHGACDKERGICHEPEPGQPEDVWWFGFDCAHAGDVMPGMEAFRQSHPEHAVMFRQAMGAEYRTADYARAETERLAAQLAAMGRRKRFVEDS